MPLYLQGDRILAKICAYCGSQIGPAKSLIGELFCSSEQSELYLQEQSQLAFARVPLSAPSPSHKQTGLVGTLESVEPRPASYVFLSTAAPPPSMKFSAPEAECFVGIRSALSQLRLPDLTPLDEFEQGHLVLSPELKPLLLTTENNRFEAEPEAVTSAPERPPESFEQNTAALAPVRSEPISSHAANSVPDRVANPMPDNVEPGAARPRYAIARHARYRWRDHPIFL
jgi:hypothetical protein